MFVYVQIGSLYYNRLFFTFGSFRPEDSVEQMSSMDAEQIFHGVNNVLTAICPRLKEFHTILTDPPKVCIIRCQLGTVGSLFGFNDHHIQPFPICWEFCVYVLRLITKTHNNVLHCQKECWSKEIKISSLMLIYEGWFILCLVDGWTEMWLFLSCSNGST